MTAEELIRIRVQNDQDVFAMRRLGREVAETVGLEAQDQIRVATALSEIGREVLGEGIDASVAFLIQQEGLLITIGFAAEAASAPRTV
ncbi:hypothetical protein ACFQX6_27680 [Streptosporangium lutulentum]